MKRGTSNNPPPFRMSREKDERDWVLSESLPLVQHTTPSPAADDLAPPMGQHTLTSSQEESVSYRSPNSFDFDPNHHSSSSSNSSSPRLQSKKRNKNRAGRLVSVKKEEKKKRKAMKTEEVEVLVLECPHCRSVGECHETKYGAFCYIEARKSLAGMTQNDMFLKYAGAYTTLLNWEVYRVAGASDLDGLLAYVPACMLAGSYTKLCNTHHSYNT
jgi:hypothetical protein